MSNNPPRLGPYNDLRKKYDHLQGRCFDLFCLMLLEIEEKDATLDQLRATLADREAEIVTITNRCLEKDNQLRGEIAALTRKAEEMDSVLAKFEALRIGPVGYCSEPIYDLQWESKQVRSAAQSRSEVDGDG